MSRVGSCTLSQIRLGFLERSGRRLADANASRLIDRGPAVTSLREEVRSRAEELGRQHDRRKRDESLHVGGLVVDGDEDRSDLGVRERGRDDAEVTTVDELDVGEVLLEPLVHGEEGEARVDGQTLDVVEEPLRDEEVRGLEATVRLDIERSHGEAEVIHDLVSGLDKRAVRVVPTTVARGSVVRKSDRLSASRLEEALDTSARVADHRLSVAGEEHLVLDESEHGRLVRHRVVRGCAKLTVSDLSETDERVDVFSDVRTRETARASQETSPIVLVGVGDMSERLSVLLPLEHVATFTDSFRAEDVGFKSGKDLLVPHDVELFELSREEETRVHAASCRGRSVEAKSFKRVCADLERHAPEVVLRVPRVGCSLEVEPSDYLHSLAVDGDVLLDDVTRVTVVCESAYGHLIVSFFVCLLEFSLGYRRGDSALV
jgi:hypothetical protein